MTYSIKRRVAIGIVSAALLAGAAPSAFAEMGSASNMKSDPMVGGAAMYPSKTIVENAMNSKDHTTLVAAVKAAGLVDTLSGAGPFTVFAPTNEAFDQLPAGAVNSLLQPDHKDMLVKVLTYHVVAGRYSAKDLMNMIKDGGGKATLMTVQGEPLTVTEHGMHLDVTDTKGGVARVTISNVFQSNGVIHVVDEVLMPG